MARSRTIKRSIKRSKKKKFLSLLPDPLQAFLARRLVDIFASILTAAGLFLLTALLSYDHTDPSWNTAGATEAALIGNWMGAPGAWVSDLLLQTLGIGAFAIAAALMVWGLRCFRRQPISPLSLRTIALMITTISLSIAFAQIPSGGWTVHPYLGSSAGTLLLERLSSISPALGYIGIPIIAAFIALATFIYAAATTREEMSAFFEKTSAIVTSAASFSFNAWMAFQGWITHYNDPEYASDFWERLRQSRARAAAEKPKRQPMISAPEAPAIQPRLNAPVQPQITPRAPMTISSSAAAIPVVAPAAKETPAPVNQQRFSLENEGEWDLPSMSLLTAAPPDYHDEQLNEDALRKNAELLQNVLNDFNVQGEIVSIHPGPVVTLYELEPAPGTKTSRVISLADDIARSMSAVSVRCAVVPGRNVIGIELPNKVRQTVYMQELLASRLSEKSNAKLPLLLGKDISGQPMLADLSKMPHLLVAGTTGSGKSVAVNTMILSLLFRLPPEDARAFGL